MKAAPLFVLVLLTALLLGAADAPAASPAAGFALPAAGAVPGSLTDYVMGNRSRMIQITTIAFALGLVILMTSTRKH